MQAKYILWIYTKQLPLDIFQNEAKFCSELVRNTNSLVAVKSNTTTLVIVKLQICLVVEQQTLAKPVGEDNGIATGKKSYLFLNMLTEYIS